jgi:hypothetical protein
MPAYNPALTTNLGVGEQQTLVASTDTGITSTIAIAIGRDGAQPAILAVFNSTNQQAIINAAPVDAAGQYLQFYIVAAGTSVYLSTTGPFVNASFTVAPTSGTLIVVR